MASAGVAASGAPTVTINDATTPSQGAAVQPFHNADGQAFGTGNGLLAGGLELVFNGTAYDRARSASAANLAASAGLGATLIALPGQWAVTHNPGAAAQPTIAKAAVAATRHVCTSISITLAAGATAQAAITVNLRDGATGAGTILQSWTIACPVSDSRSITLPGLNIPGSVNTAMTLEFAAATAATVQGAVSMTGYDAV